ncbi:Cardiolipin synthase N-terminal [Flavobacteriaceae bacterium]
MNTFYSILPFVILLHLLILFAFVLLRIFNNEKLNAMSKTLWLLIVLTIPFIGSVSYMMLNKKSDQI